MRIGYIDYEGFFDKNEDGSFSGYGGEMLKKISSYTDWEYEFVFDSFSNHLENLKTGKIDLICHAKKNDERKESYLFSKYSVGAESSMLYVRQSDDRFYYDDFNSLNGIKIGFLQGTFQNDEFSNYAQEHGFTYLSDYYDTQADAFKALDEKKVDAVAMCSLGGEEGHKVISLFGSDPFYFMTGMGNEELMEELDCALGQIFAANPTYTSELFNKYYGTKAAANGMLLTREEAEYIAACKTLTVGLMDGRSPLSYMDKDGNQKRTESTADILP